jgi:HK97 gp10 family phage protein
MVAMISHNITAGIMILKKVEKDAEKKVAQETKNVAALILRTAKSNIHNRSGNLRRSGRLEDETVRAGGTNFVNIMIVFGGEGTSVNYASFVETGTVYQQPQWYLRRAVLEHESKLKDWNLSAFEKSWDAGIHGGGLLKLI